MAQVNYSAEMTAKIVSDYQNGVDVADIAASVEKSRPFCTVEAGTGRCVRCEAEGSNEVGSGSY